MKQWAWLVAVCVVLALPTAIYPGTKLADVTYLAGLVLEVAGLWVGASACRGAARRGWALVALTASCWLVADIVSRFIERFTDMADAVMTPADILWLGSYPLLVAAIIVMIRARGLAPAVMREVTLDVAATTMAASVGAWQFLISPLISDGSFTLYKAMVVLYPLGDIAVFALVLTLVLAPGIRRMPSFLLVGCLGSTLLLDSAYTFLPPIFPAFDLSRIDAGLLVSNALLAAAALHPGRGELIEEPSSSVRVQQLHRWRVVLLGAALGSVSAVAAVSSESTTDRFLMVGASFIISAIILVRFYGVVRDKEQAEELLAHRASHDQLTGLANRDLLWDGVTAALAPARGAAVRDFALLYIDLDGFKKINDTFGHSAGDEILRVVSQRLTQLVRRGDTVARVGGDEFVLLCLDVIPDAVPRLSERVQDAIQLPVPIGTGVMKVGASVGVLVGAYMDRSHNPDADHVLKIVDAAMYVAKRAGGGVRLCETQNGARDAANNLLPNPIHNLPAPRSVTHKLV